MKMVWRQKFSECCEAIYRELGFSPPEMTHDDLLPLGMELEYAGLLFELVHFPSDMPERVLVSCSLGEIPGENILAGLRNIMEKNLMLVRAHSAYFGISTDNGDFRCLYYEPLEECNHLRWLERMREIAKNAVDMKNSCFDRRKFNLVAGESDQITLLA